MKKALIIIAVVLLSPILLFGILALLIYCPPVQNFVVDKVCEYASEEMGMQISVERVHLEFPLNLGVEGINVLQPNDSIAGKLDTVADIRNTVVDIQFRPLFDGDVEVDILELNNMKFNTTHFIHEARVKGTADRLKIESHGINLRDQLLRIDDALLSNARVDIELSDTVPPDTTKSETFWKIKVDHLCIDNTNVTLHMPGDTLQVEAGFGKLEAKDGNLDLEKSAYKVGSLLWKDGMVKYDNNFTKRTKGLDTNHIYLSAINMEADSISYLSPDVSLNLNHCSFKENGSGLVVNELSTPFHMDSTRVEAPILCLKTPNSNVNANIKLDLNAFDDNNPGKVFAAIDASIGKQDILHLAGSNLPKGFAKGWPNRQLTIKGIAKGNTRRVDMSALRISLPTAFDTKVNGFVTNITNPEKMSMDIDLGLRTHNIGFLTPLLGSSLPKDLRIPNEIGVEGKIKSVGKHYIAKITASEGGGRLKGDIDLNLKTEAYKANVDAHKLQLQHFLPKMGLSPFSGKIVAEGRGFNFMSPRTSLKAKADISSFSYGGYNVSGTNADINLSGGMAKAIVHGSNELFDGDIAFDGNIGGKNKQASLKCNLSTLDLYRLKLVNQPLSLSFNGDIDLATNLKDYYEAHGQVSGITVTDKYKTYFPGDLYVDLLLNTDTTHANIKTGDFHLSADGPTGFKAIMSASNRIMAELHRQMDNHIIDQHAILNKLPELCLKVNSGKDNMVARSMKYLGYEYRDVLVDIDTSPSSGINGIVSIDSLVVDSMRLDVVSLDFVTDSTGVNYKGRIQNFKDNPQYQFKALFNGNLIDNGLTFNSSIYDRNDDLGLALGLSATMEERGIRARMHDLSPVLGYKTFHANADNYILLGRDKRVSANMQLVADDRTGVQIYTNDDNLEALQDLTVSLNRFDVEKIMSVIPYTPSMSGTMNGDFHVIQTREDLSVSSSIDIMKMVYEGCPMGDVNTEFVYMPRSNDEHVVFGTLSSNGYEVGRINGSYFNKDGGRLDAELTLDDLPMSMANGFIPDQIIGFKGYANGSLTARGPLKELRIDGTIRTDSAHLISVPYGVDLRFGDDKIKIVGSHLNLNDFKLYAYNDKPLTLNGNVDFSNFDNINMNMRMRAENIEIINAKENPKSETYGKAFVNIFGIMQGPLSSLQMRGKVDILGATDMTYILRDSPMSEDNRLKELVTFTDLSDSTQQVVKRPQLSGFNMDMSITVNEAAHVKCDLGSDHTNYIDVTGGGDLRMQYNNIDNLTLYGRYTIYDGEMKYQLPVIPLRTFNIADGSYVEFTGNPMNPALNITATEDMKSTVAEGDGTNGRLVEFEVGVELSKTLQDMGIKFIIDAPKDMTIHNDLMSMSIEQRGKLAVTMLTTGMYLADGNTSQFTMNTALSAFLQNEINNITGSALRTLDISIGMENTTDAIGNIHTDYAFKFAKRFWNNRLNVIVGGKISTGAEMENEDNTIFNNVGFEYRLNKASTQYLKLYYNKNSYDWLEGSIGEFGAGFIWKRKLSTFRDIFNFNSESGPTMPPPVRKNNEEKVDTLDAANTITVKESSGK